MKSSDRIKRMVAFYFSVGLFCVTLPIVLSYALGYTIDYKEFCVYKTGIISINSQPAGASVYLNGKKITDSTPAQIEELRPGSYKIEVRRDGFYPWEKELDVLPGMVTKADRIVLFPVMRDMVRLGGKDAVDFAVSEAGQVYTMTTSGLYRSNIDGGSARRIALFSNWPRNIIGKRFSPDGKRFLFFNEYSIWVVSLDTDTAIARNGVYADVDEVVTSQEKIIDIFWYLSSGYIIIVTDKNVKVIELRTSGRPNIVTLYKFNTTPRGIYYDAEKASLYFIDTDKESEGNAGSLYRLDLKQKFFDQLMQLLQLRRDTETKYEKKR